MNTLKFAAAATAVTGLMMCGQVIAADPVPRATMTKHQAMNDCLEQQKALDVTMSKAQMKRLCKDKLKQQKATGDMPEQPAGDPPRTP